MKEEIIDNFSKPFELQKGVLLRTELHYIDNKKTMLYGYCKECEGGKI